MEYNLQTTIPCPECSTQLMTSQERHLYYCPQCDGFWDYQMLYRRHIREQLNRDTHTVWQIVWDIPEQN